MYINHNILFSNYNINYLINNINYSNYKKKKKNMNKMTPFECGFNSMSNKRLPFSSHFFIIGMMFLIFDIEIIIIMPMILTMKFSMMKSWMMTSFLILTILIMGLYHEWYNGMLKWTK
uniref:NADH dehydrogenase subunit 3 n=1 Tax=Batracomorphus chlorophana TaxID=1962539 RepID=UPI00257A1DA8|nr:NADH dehydrogenase subunit 3 [Batracomorphus chlorophana]WHE42579.1 NADH dehydrogenase subunit 3 [Batracomorphus chlorophana]